MTAIQNIDPMEYANMLARSNFVPQAYRGKPEEILIAIQYGADLGLKPIQSLKNISVINGTPTVWGDAMMAICRTHPDWEDIEETLENGVAICRVKRRGEKEKTFTFSIEQAKTSGSWGNTPSWKKYPDRMLTMRARGFALRSVYADALAGMIMAEEAMDYDHAPQPKQIAEKPKSATLRALAALDDSAPWSEDKILHKYKTAYDAADWHEVVEQAKQFVAANPDKRDLMKEAHLAGEARIKQIYNSEPVPE